MMGNGNPCLRVWFEPLKVPATVARVHKGELAFASDGFKEPGLECTARLQQTGRQDDKDM